MVDERVIEKADNIPNSGMISAAKRALEWKKQGKAGGTQVGMTRAHQIVSRENLSDSTVKRMYSFFSRHEVDKKATGFNSGEEGYPSPGRVAWDLWGGDAGYSWSRQKANSLRKEYSYGTLSPITSSSGKTEEQSDNYIEYYVKKSDPDELTPSQEEQVKDYQRRVKAHGLFSQSSSHYVTAKDNPGKEYGDVCANCVFYNIGKSSCCIVSGKIQANGYCDLAIIPESNKEGGEKNMTEKGYDVGDSEVTNTSYDPGITSTTEPDPISTLAMQKDATYDRTAGQEGVGAFSTTANSTVQAPAPGATTEPTFADNKKVAPTIAGEAVNKDDGINPNMQLCNCMGMSKCVGCACAGCQTCDGCDNDQCQGCACDHSVTKNSSCCDGCDDDCDGSCCPACIDMMMGWSDDDDDDSDYQATEPQNPATSLYSMIQAIDASMDTVNHMISGQDLSTLPFWASQSLTAAISAGVIVDEIMENYGIYNPDVDGSINKSMAPVRMEKKEFSTARRKQLAREGKAMPDGSYPIENVQDLKNAIRAWGRGGAKPADKAHIISRARALGAMQLIPDNWKKNIKKSIWGNSFLPVDSLWNG
jgi:hypothetical protein